MMGKSKPPQEMIHDAEVLMIDKVVSILSDLSQPGQRERVMMYLAFRFGLARFELPIATFDLPESSPR